MDVLGPLGPNSIYIQYPLAVFVPSWVVLGRLRPSWDRLGQPCVGAVLCRLQCNLGDILCEYVLYVCACDYTPIFTRT